MKKQTKIEILELAKNKFFWVVFSLDESSMVPTWNMVEKMGTFDTYAAAEMDLTFSIYSHIWLEQKTEHH